MSNRTLVIWNGNAGSTEKAKVLRARLEDSTLVDVCEPKDRAEAIAAVQKGVANGVRLVIAAGGDGTVSSVVNGLCTSRRGATLGILPLGTGNDLCRTMGIPLDPMEASELLWPAVQRSADRPRTRKRPPPAPLRRIDVVEARSPTETVCFANAASGGNAGDVAKHVTAEMKQRWGPWCYVHGAIAVMTGLSDYDTEIVLDRGPAERHRTWAMIIANGRTAGGGVEVAPVAEVDDGLMDVILILESSPIEAALLTTNYLLGSFLDNERVIHRRAKHAAIRCEPDAKFVADGEPLTGGPLRFRVRPGALKIIAPLPLPPQTADEPAAKLVEQELNT